MAAENIRGDTPKQSPPVVENEQFSDIILILDKMELLLVLAHQPQERQV